MILYKKINVLYAVKHLPHFLSNLWVLNKHTKKIMHDMFGVQAGEEMAYEKFITASQNDL